MAEQEMPENYETIGRILSEAGFFLQARNETTTAEGGVITTAYENIISKNTEADEEVKTDDVAVYNGSESIEVKEIDAEAGRITLADESVSGTLATTYHYSPVAVSFVKVVREDVQNRIRKKLSGMSGCLCAKTDEFKSSLRMITRLWAAGLLQTKDYGYNVDNEDTAKDGYRKISEAKSLLDDLYNECAEECGQDDVNGGAADAIGGSGGNLFGEFRGHRPHSEEF